jgi:cell division protein FtsB
VRRQVKLKMFRRERANQKELANLQRTVDRLRDHNRQLQDDNARLRRIVRAIELHHQPTANGQ